MPKFRLLRGRHQGGGKLIKDEHGNLVQDPNNPQRTYKAGDIVEDEVDLVAKFGHEKFELLDDDGRPLQAYRSFRPKDVDEIDDESGPQSGGDLQRDDLEAMTVEDLKAHAESEGIDLSGCHKKAEIIDAIAQYHGI